MLGPNITGSIKNFAMHITSSGAFYAGANYSAWNPTGTTDNEAVYIYFDASRSDSTYTTNGNVYPLSLTLNYIIKC